mgnify:CR=1 FL=1
MPVSHHLRRVRSSCSESIKVTLRGWAVRAWFFETSMVNVSESSFSPPVLNGVVRHSMIQPARAISYLPSCVLRRTWLLQYVQV